MCTIRFKVDVQNIDGELNTILRLLANDSLLWKAITNHFKVTESFCRPHCMYSIHFTSRCIIIWVIFISYTHTHCMIMCAVSLNYIFKASGEFFRRLTLGFKYTELMVQVRYSQFRVLMFHLLIDGFIIKNQLYSTTLFLLNRLPILSPLSKRYFFQLSFFSISLYFAFLVFKGNQILKTIKPLLYKKN